MSISDKLKMSGMTLAIFGLCFAGSSLASAMWLDSGQSNVVVFRDSQVMGRIGTVESIGEPSELVKIGDASAWFWSAPQEGRLGEAVQGSGVAHWDVPLHAFNGSYSDQDGVSTMYLGVKAIKSSPWHEAKFVLKSGACGETPSFDGAKKVDTENNTLFFTTHKNQNSDADSQYCLWGKLPSEALKTYTSSGSGDSAMTGDLLGADNKSDSQAGYHNDVTVRGSGVVSRKPATGSDNWDLYFKRYPNPKTGDISMLFKPVYTSGVCTPADTE